MIDLLYQKGDMIADRYVVQELSGNGASSQVFKVLDTVVNEVYALKMLTSEEDQREGLMNEFKILKDISHDNIVKFYDVGVAPGSYFLKLEYIGSRPLRESILARLISFAKAKEIMVALLGALQYLFDKGISHRDIKPSNILMSEKGPILVDFNVSKVGVTSGPTQDGTFPYQPPELPIEGWHKDGDLYALGIILFEMLTSTHPFKDHSKEAPPDPRIYNQAISEGLALFVLRSIAPKRDDRFHTPQEMLADLEKVDWAPVRKRLPRPELVAAIAVPAEERSKPNNNPYLTRFLTLYSQSRISTSGTTGLDDFARATYVDTLLDLRLTASILTGDHRLVIITGNAGDGKTAFIQKFEDHVEHHSDTLFFNRMGSRNGVEFSYKGYKFQTNYDGSQDEGEVKNDDVLLRFFKPFMGDAAPSSSSSVHVIAINEGRLLDFVHTHRKEFTFLDDLLHRMLGQGSGNESGVLLVNLNLRSVVADDADASIFGQMIDAFVQPALWEPCDHCDLRQRCYVRFNVDSLQNVNFGPQIKERLQVLVRIAHFRRRMHITVRNLRSALSFLLFGTLECDGIHRFAEDASLRSSYVSNFYYNGWFKKGVSSERGTFVERQESDRLVSLLSEVDPGKVTNPVLDAKLAFGPAPLDDHAWLFPTFDGRSGVDLELLDADFQEAQDVLQRAGTKDRQDPTWKESKFRYTGSHMALRRKYFFERTDGDWGRMLPYRDYEDFYRLVNDGETERVLARDELVRAITRSEGFQDPRIAAGDLVLRTSYEKLATIKSFRRFRKDDFTCEVVGIGKMQDLIEFLPSDLLIRYKEGITLVIDIDLYEMLERILEGFRPSINELNGAFIDLLIFKRQLSSERFEEVLLTQDEKVFYQVVKTSPGSLRLGTLKGGM
jgi:serine/threonine protein kinase